MIIPPIPNMAAGARAGAWFIEGPRDAAFVPEDAMRVARDNGLGVVREYACLDMSEGRRSTRLRVISDLENGVITTLIAADLSVIAQSNPDLQDLANALARSESRLILFDDGLDTDRSGGRAFADVILGDDDVAAFDFGNARLLARPITGRSARGHPKSRAVWLLVERWTT